MHRACPLCGQARACRCRAERVLGAGTYGCVFQVAVDARPRKRRVADSSGGSGTGLRRVAIKIIPGSASDERVYVETSMPCLRGLLCPERAWVTPSSLIVQFPLGVCDAEALATMCGARLPMGAAASILLQVAQSVRRIHTRHIMHRDVTSSNLILTRDGAALLADPSLARHVWGDNVLRTQYTPVVTQLAYRAPEVLTRSGYSQQVDVWALGCLAVLLLSGEELFSEDCVEDQAQHIEALLGVRLGGTFPSSSSDVTDDGDDCEGGRRRPSTAHGLRRRLTRNMLRWRWRSLDDRLAATWKARATLERAAGAASPPDLTPQTADEEACWVGFIRSCLCVDPAQRLSAADAVAQLKDLVDKYDARLTSTTRLAEILATYVAPRARATTPPDTASVAVHGRNHAPMPPPPPRASHAAPSDVRTVLLHNCLSFFLRDPAVATRLAETRRREFANAAEVNLGATSSNGVTAALLQCGGGRTCRGRGGGGRGADRSDDKRRLVERVRRRRTSLSLRDVPLLSAAARRRAVALLDAVLPREGCGADETFLYAHLIAITLLDTFVATGEFHRADAWASPIGTQTASDARRMVDDPAWRLDVCVSACCVVAATRAGFHEFTMSAAHEAAARNAFLRIFCALGGDTLVYTPCELASITTPGTEALAVTMRHALHLSEALPVHLAAILIDATAEGGDDDGEAMSLAVAKKLTPRTLLQIFGEDEEGGDKAAAAATASAHDVLT